MFNKANTKYKSKSASVTSFFKPAKDSKSTSAPSKAGAAKSTKSLQWSNKGFDAADDTDSDSEIITLQETKVGMNANSGPKVITVDNLDESDSESDDGFVTAKQPTAARTQSSVSSLGKRLSSVLDAENKENMAPIEAKRQKSLGALMAGISTQKALRHVSDEDKRFGFAHFDASSRPQWADEFDQPNVAQARDAEELSAIELSDEQKKILTCAIKGESFFFTGPAGTGKSVLLREIIRVLKETMRPEEVAVTATTGLAALNIQGETLHRWAGVGLATDDSEKLIKKLSKAKNSNWRKVRVLIIDEVSMLDASFFDKLVEIARELGPSRVKPFGGYQLICTGDFYQLPPVHSGPHPPPYCFKGKYWSSVFSKQFQLTQVFRQKGDNAFVAILNRLRIGQVDGHIVSELKKLERPLIKTPSGLEPTRLFPRKPDFIRENERRLQALDKLECTFKSYDYLDRGTPTEKNDVPGTMDNATRFDRRLILKKDAQVMCTKNTSSQGLVNGQKGLVLGFTNVHIWSQVLQLAREYPEAKEMYYLLFDTTTPGNNIDFFRKTLPSGQIFRFFSKIRGEVIKVLREAGNEFQCYQKDSPPGWCPIVKFTGNLVETLLNVEELSIFDGKSDPRGGRVQMPITLAYALSIHKSQGQTLDGVIVDLGRVFEKGQAYVALSRAVSKEGLQVLNFSPQKVMASKEVHDFYANMTRIT